MELTKEALDKRRQELVSMLKQLQANIEAAQKRVLMCNGALQLLDENLATLAMPGLEPEAEEEAADTDAEQDEPTPS